MRAAECLRETIELNPDMEYEDLILVAMKNYAAKKCEEQITICYGESVNCTGDKSDAVFNSPLPLIN